MFLIAAQLLAMALLGQIKYESPMPIVSSNSRAISAACHRLPRSVEVDGHLKSLRWGVVHTDQHGIGHCSFTAAPDAEIYELKEGHLYR